MKKEINYEVENNEEVKKIKSKYKKMLKIILLTILIILIVLIIRTVYVFNICQKTIKVNMTSSFGDNYKITRISNGNITFTYRKDNLFQNVHANGTALVIVDKKAYVFNLEKKEYQEIEWQMSNPLEAAEDEVNKIGIFVDYILSGTKIKKEEYKGKKYIVIQDDTKKLWVNPETYYIEKELSSGQVLETTIEKNVVKDNDILYYNLDEYKKIEE